LFDIKKTNYQAELENKSQLTGFFINSISFKTFKPRKQDSFLL